MRTKNEKQVKLNISLIIIVIGILISIADAIYSVVKTSEQHTMLGYVLVGVLVCFTSIFLLFFEHIGGIDWVFKIINLVHKDDYVGNWLLKIEYVDEQGITQKRHGYCAFESGITGLRIVGKQILDENNNVAEDKWRADKVEIIENNNRIILIYTYIIHDDVLTNPIKIGLATSTCISASKKEFNGEFSDYFVEKSAKKLAREGKISLVMMK